ncbi:MAG: toxin, partial [Sphingobacteriales bacterium]
MGSPFAMTYGGEQIGAVLGAESAALELGTTISTYVAQLSLTIAGYQRRESDWRLQSDLAAADMEQIQFQLDANQVSQDISRRDLANHKVAIAQSAAVEAFLENKFTNTALYQWMISRVANVYFQTYSIAYELALAAERAYQFELNVNTSFINYGYWNNLQKGLTAGETLMLALNQMEKSFIDNNVRTLEINRNISLMQLNPRALMDLINTGECIVEFPESLFDHDYPGHYARKIKTISMSIPAVVGPYQNIKATLTQTSSQVIIKPVLNAVNYLLGGDDASMPGANDMRSNWLVSQQVAISTGINDAGMFELSFNDERYLPFEGTGAVSTWRLSMSPMTNHIDFDSISDVIFQLRYTALDGGAKFRSDVIGLPA